MLQVVTDEPLVSVVTPVYNGQEYLEECVESVLNQTYRNWTLVIVDNASTDRTPDIASRFARRDSRISHIRFEDFVDAIDNHNRAFETIDRASEFCKVVQADDWIYPECLALMVEVAQGSPTVGVVGSYRLSNAGVDLTGLPYVRTVFDGREIIRGELLHEWIVLGAPTSMLLRTRFMAEREPPFYRLRGWAADTESTYWMLSQHDFGFVHRVLTYERRQGGRRFEYALKMNALGPEFLYFHLLYGPMVLTAREYRTKLRLLLRNYAWWHVRQSPRPSRMRDDAFFNMHEEACKRILALGAGDREVRLTMNFIGALLARRQLRRAHPQRSP